MTKKMKLMIKKMKYSAVLAGVIIPNDWSVYAYNAKTGDVLWQTATKFYVGTPAVADGVVNHTGYVDGFGLVVVLEHDSYATVYAHLGRIQVSRGASVDQGDPLGLVGETGVIDGGGPRLHFEVRYHQSPQNPLQWLRSRGGSR